MNLTPGVQELFDHHLEDLKKLIADKQKAAAGLQWGSMRTIFAPFPDLMKQLEPYLAQYHALPGVRHGS
jgi:hypothetical protein